MALSDEIAVLATSLIKKWTKSPLMCSKCGREGLKHRASKYYQWLHTPRHQTPAGAWCPARRTFIGP